MRREDDTNSTNTIEIEEEMINKKERDIRVSLLAHRFLRADDKDWRLVKGKLIDLFHVNRKQFADKLCVKCLTVYSSNRGLKHQNVSVSSIFDHINPRKAEDKEIAEFFAKNGRTKRDNDGMLLIGVPTFHHPCLPIYRFLEGSTVPECFREKDNEEEPRLLYFQEPMIITKILEKIQIKPRKQKKSLHQEQLQKIEKKNSNPFLTPNQKEKKIITPTDIKTPESLLKREPVTTPWLKERFKNSTDKSKSKIKMKSTILPFVVHTGRAPKSLMQELINDLKDK